MKLILTSRDFLNEKSRKFIIDNLELPIEECKILFIPNAKATLEKILSDKYYKRVEEYGFKKENIYIFNYYDPKSFIDLDINTIYVGGGNTFELIDRLRKCHFDMEIDKYVKRGITYIGGSAGTHIITKNIKHVLAFDENTPGITDFNGLGLFDGIIFCHYTKDKEKFYRKALSEKEFNIYTLTDEESIIVKN